MTHLSTLRCSRRLVLGIAFMAVGRTLLAQTPDLHKSDVVIPLVVSAGRPLRVALDHRLVVRRVGQVVTATVIEPIYAYDRVVVPVGATVSGRIVTLDALTRRSRILSGIRGDLTPVRLARVQFDTLTLPGGEAIALATTPVVGTANVGRRVAGEKKGDPPVEVVTGPTKGERAKDWALGSLPVHRTVLPRGTLFVSHLEAPLDFGLATPVDAAPPESAPAEDAQLHARLLTTVSSETATKGDLVEAVLTQPLLAADGRLVLPEGTAVLGHVTLAKPARRWHRAGQLRVLFDAVRVGEANAQRMLASVQSVDVARDAHVTLDDEGGASVASSKARLVAPALAGLALAGGLHGRLDYDTDGAGPEMAYGGVTTNYVGGFLGGAALGAGLSQLWRPLTLGIAAVGLARSTYTTIVGRGHEVRFPADSALALQLAPRQSPEPGKVR